MNKTKVSCIIPAYDEEKTVAGVVKSALSCPEITEVIVVNDGSADETLKKLEKLKSKITVIDLKQNRGKGYAVAQGVKAAQYPYLLFLDADLINLKKHHLFSLINPVVSNLSDMTIGINSQYNASNYFLWRFSGQRCLKKRSVIPALKKIEATNYGLEVILNDHFKNKRIIIVPLLLNKKFHFIKTEKEEDWAANYLKEVWEVFQKTVSLKSSAYRQKIRQEFLQNISSYLRISYEKAKKYLNDKA
ncbi:MAG: glycosyltransferase family 2 protein [Candidatus Shapirobacteria bacterium]